MLLGLYLVSSRNSHLWQMSLYHYLLGARASNQNILIWFRALIAQLQGIR